MENTDSTNNGNLPAPWEPSGEMAKKAEQVQSTFKGELQTVREEGKWEDFKAAIQRIARRYDVDIDHAEFLRIMASMQFANLSAEEARKGAEMVVNDPRLGERYERWGQNIDGNHIREALQMLEEKQTAAEAERLTRLHDLTGEWWRRVSNKEDGENYRYVPPPDERD